MLGEAEFWYGCGGFVLFEALRIYRRLWAGGKVAPLERWGVYIIVILLLGGGAGIVAGLWGDGSVARAVFLGFSVPTGVRALLEGGRRDLVDDIEIKDSRGAGAVVSWTKRYFGL